MLRPFADGEDRAASGCASAVPAFYRDPRLHRTIRPAEEFTVGSMAADLKQILELEWLSPDEITARTREVYGAVLRQSRYLDGANFTAFHPADLERVFTMRPMRLRRNGRMPPPDGLSGFPVYDDLIPTIGA